MSAPINEEPVREHSYDGIQEYDKNLPNWWLFTLYGSIVFAVAYWVYYQKTGAGPTQVEELRSALAAYERPAASAATDSSGGSATGSSAAATALTDDELWGLSQDSQAVAAGQSLYQTTCAACHGPTLAGAIGVSLVDSEWIHGSNPLAIRATIANGILEKGMPGWQPILGEEKVNQVTAFVLSHHQKP